MDQTNQKSLFILAGGLALLCILICVVTWYPVRMLENLREEYDTLESDRQNLAITVENFSIVKENLERLAIASPKNINPVSDIVEFYAYVRQAAENNDINIISTKQNQNSISMNLRGGYYSLMHLIADWRTMPAAAKITSIRIHRDKDAPSLFVTADITLAALIEGEDMNQNRNNRR